MGTTASLDWRGGAKLRPWVEGAFYQQNGAKYTAASLKVEGADVGPYPKLLQQQGQAVAHIRGSAIAYLELPPEPGTYVFTFRLMGSQGTYGSTWGNPDHGMS